MDFKSAPNNRVNSRLTCELLFSKIKTLKTSVRTNHNRLWLLIQEFCFEYTGARLPAEKQITAINADNTKTWGLIKVIIKTESN